MANFGHRIYQERAVAATFDGFERGTDSLLLVLPTGTGKTIISAIAIERYLAETGRRVLFLAQREKLVTQAFDKFTRHGLNASVEMAGQDARETDGLLGKSDVVCGSVQSLQKARLLRWERDTFGLILIDEAHHAIAPMYASILNHFDGYRLAGMTATPDRGDQKNLGSLFHEKVFDYPIRHAIGGDGDRDPGGWLVPPRTRRCMVDIDLKGIQASGRDFNLGDLEDRIGPKIEPLARAIVAEIGPRQTVVFTPDVGSAQAMADVLRQLGLTAEYVSGSGGKFGMPKAEAIESLAQFESGRVQVVVTCEYLIEGWDHPPVSAVVVCRPTRMRYRYAQMVGRGLRPDPDGGKEDCLVIDFDWTTDAGCRDLALSVDLFDDGSMPEDVIKLAREIEIEAKGTRDDPQEIVEEAEEIVRVKSRLQIKLTGKTAQYKAMETDPIGVGKLLGIKFNAKHDMDSRGNNPASPAQLGLLRHLGIKRPDGISKWGASKLIDKLQRRQAQSQASIPQVRAMLGNGVDPDVARGLSADSAATALAEIAHVKQLLPKTQRHLFDGHD